MEMLQSMVGGKVRNGAAFCRATAALLGSLTIYG